MKNTIASIAVLASGRGTNFEAIEQAVRCGQLPAKIVAVISDRADATVIEKARKAGIPAKALTLSGLSREEQDSAVLQAFGSELPRFLVLAGYMKLVGPRLIRAFDSGQGYSRIVNVHPSLLPAFPGLRSYQKAFEYGCAVTGVTVHLVDQGLDQGPVCAQESFSISDCRDADEVERRGLEVEHRLYPQTLSWIVQEKFKLVKVSDGRICVRQS